MEKFLTRVAAHINTKHNGKFRGVTVLMPNHRSCVYLAEELRALLPADAYLPEIITLKDWIFKCSNLTLIEPLEQVLRLYEIYKTKDDAEAFEEFVSTGRIMLGDFDEVDTQLVEPASFFRSLEHLQSMKVYEPGGDESEYTIRYKKFWRIFRELYFELREQLLTDKKGYAGMLYREVAENITRRQSEINPERKFYLIGFSSLAKSEESIIKFLKQRAHLEPIFDTDNYFIDDGYQEAGNFFRAQRNKLKSDEVWQNDLIGTRVHHVNIVGVAKNIGQTKVVADILANKLNLTPATERETAVIVLDEKLLNPLLGAVPQNISAINISMGFPVKESPVAGLLRCIFSLHDNVERFKNNRRSKLRFYYKDVMDILHHPYTTFLITDKKAVTKFLEEIRRFNKMMVSLDELKERLGAAGVTQLFWYNEDTGGFLNNLLTLIENLKQSFYAVTEHGEKDMGVDLELLFNVGINITALHNTLAAGHVPLTAPALRKLVTENLRDQRVPFDGEPVRGLQLMGMIETQCLDFKNVVVVSMNEGIFPSSKTQNTYVPFEMRQEYLTTHKHRDANAAYLFYRLLQRAENVYLLYNTESDEMGGGEKSRFILQLQHELHAANKNAVVTDLVYSVPPPPPLPDDDIVINKEPELLQKILKGNDEYGLSPSALNTYINCTLQYYLRYIAKLREQDDVEESIVAADLGTAVHYVLEKIYGDILNQPVTIEFIERVAGDKVRINALLQESFAKRFEQDSLKQGKNYLLYRVCLKLIDEFFKQEKEVLRSLQGSGANLKVLLLESEMGYNLPVGGQNFKIKGKVDRVEECNGIISIADYKTGSPLGSSIKSDDIALFATDPKYAKAMQLLTYAWLYWRSTGSADIKLRSGIYWLRDSAKGLDSLKMDNDDRINKEVLLQFEQVLSKVVAELLDPNIPFTKTHDLDRCKYCEFVKICRRD